MRIAIIGRTETLFETALYLHSAGHQIVSVVTSKAAPEYQRSADDFRTLAIDLGAKFFLTSKMETVGPIDADIAVSMNYTGIISQSVIDQFRYGILNAHGGDLPRYRGNACHGWAILNGEPHTAVTIHRMIGAELDSGDVVERETIPLNRTTKIGEVLARVHQVTPALFVRSLARLESGFRGEPQVGPGRRCYPMLPEDGAIDWTDSAINVIRRVNACSRPFTGAFCFDENQKVVIWSADIIGDEEELLAFPGHVLKQGATFIDIATGSGALRIFEMSLPFSSIKSTRKRFRSGLHVNYVDDRLHHLRRLAPR